MAPKNKTSNTAAAESSASTHPHPPKPRPWWKHRRAKITGLIVALLALAGFVIWFFFFRPYLDTNDARIAATTVQMAPPGAGGMVIAIAVTEGSRVKADDILVELDHRVAQANLQRAKTHLALAEKDYQRTQQLAAGNGVSPRQLDTVHAAYLTAQAEEQLAQIALDNTYLRSPLDGIVIQKSTEIGDMLQPGQTAVTVADMDHAWVSANIEETRIGRIKVGQPVSISVDAGGTFTATASQFALIPAENPSGNFTKLVQRIPIKVALDPHPGRPLRVGESVEIRIKIQ
jgi:RND family efflux transporter MFP subunit